MLSRLLPSRLLTRMKSGNPSKRKIPLATRFGIVGFVAGSVYFMHWYDEELKKAKLKQEREQNLWNNTQQYNIGRNDWTLVNCRDNSVVTKEKLKEKWLLMYFGFAHCPDICPETMEKIMDIKEIHDHERKKNPELPDLEPVFVTIDPERDTPQNLAYYLEDYPSFLGLTGSSQQIKQMCKNYKIYFSVGPKSDEGEYLLDHTIVIYLINPNGVYQNHFMNRQMPPEEMHPVILQQIDLFNKFNTTSN
ncbi:unnamed protein product [Oikopleura dioica]|uniref:Thioredoxin domain-containing protein n=1 Tax=Oikopleura dioica TaxID=34765 RepID=E4XSW4_OIKDI|nr:unnamed protein product [Oikopleura dioica]